MIEIRAAHPVAPDDLAAIRTLHHVAAVADGHDSLGSAVWRDLETGGREGSAGVFASDGERLAGYAHVAPSDNFSPPHWAAGYVVDPDRRNGSVIDGLLRAVVEHVARAATGEIVLWVFDPSEHDDERTAAAGFAPQRDLLQMRVGLPLGEHPRWPAGIRVRSFRPGTDEQAWLTVNNRAFDNHPEQGGWIAATLERRMAEPWFDPDGFLLALADSPPDDPSDSPSDGPSEALAGFCWTKIHEPGTDAAGLGEIFVIGVDPARQGSGLGRALVVAGLESLAARGVRTALLYVDGANAPAVGLYRALGFTLHRRDRAYRHEVGSS